ncbi:MAG: carboxypeptidase-like regulatory domain-containing protein, partial [Bacteroidota bacterium]
MRYLIGFLFLYSHLLLIGQSHGCDQVIKGRILSLETDEPLPYATIKILDTNMGSIADEEGYFIIDGICDQEIHLEVRFIGYKTIVHHHDFHHADPVIYMAADETLLESVIIEESRLGELKSMVVQRMEVDKLELINSSIGDITNQTTGVSLLKTGSNISKPMIHGLHS